MTTPSETALSAEEEAGVRRALDGPYGKSRWPGETVRRLLATLDAERADRERQFREWKDALHRQLDAARSQPATGLTAADVERAHNDATVYGGDPWGEPAYDFDKMAATLDAARSQSATEGRETFAAVNKALAWLDVEPAEMARAAARATLLSLRAALAGDER